MLTLALLLAAPVWQAPAPQLGPIKSFGDWAVACDNVKRCEMTSLMPENGDWADEAPQLAIVREPGPGGGWTAEVMEGASARAVRLRIEGGPEGAGSWQGGKFAGADAAAIVAAMVNGKTAIVTDSAGRSGRVSLAGTSAALRFIDAEQGRAGTVTAAVARGARPAAAVPAPRPLPRISYAPPGGSPRTYSAATRAAIGRQSGCDANYEGMESKPETQSHALGGGRTLVLIPCGAGAYNFSSAAYVLGPDGKAAPARFDSPPGWVEGEGVASLVNADFDTKTGMLSSHAKGRGLGDCGSSETYVWDGAMFRLVEARAMGECRGSMNWLTVWRAEAVAR